MRKKLLTFVILSMAILPLFSQIATSPTDDFYIDATRWEQLRYTKNLPLLKPYPLNIIRRVLNDVVENGNDTERRRAQHYIDKYFSHFLHVFDEFNVDIKLKKVDSGGNESVKKWESDEVYNEKLAFTADWAINSFLGLSVDLGGIVRSNEVEKSDILPRFVPTDETDVTIPANFNAGDVDFLINPNAVFTWGNETMHGSFGINRQGYGLFFDDSIILNPNAYQSLNAVFNYNGKIFSFTQSFAALAATNRADKDEFNFGKFMCFHAIKFPIPKTRLSFSLFESVIFHKPFMAAYLLPIPYFIVANVGGFDDNVMSGLNIEWKPGCIGLVAEVLFDDLNPKQILKLKFNEAAIRTAFKLGFVYTPRESPCEYISVNYMLITPYTYTKYNRKDKKFNYLDYTNFGSALGSSLPPNSDTIGMTISWRLFDNLRLRTSTSFSRHGNPYQDLDDDEVIKMSKKHYNSAGFIDSDTRGASSAEDVTGFLKQHDIMYIMQASFLAQYEQKIPRAGSLTFQVQYTFEYIDKDGVDTPIFTGHYTTADAVKQSREEWEDRLHTSFYHYFVLGVKYLF